MSELVAILETLEKPLLVLLGAIAAGLMGPITDRLRARTAAEWWEAQERWRFKAQIYTRTLTVLKRMRQPLEVAVVKGIWPDPKVWAEIVGSAQELIEPAVVSRIWLTREAIEPLETLGMRIFEFEKRRQASTDKMVLTELCDLLEADIAALQRVAQMDLRLRLGNG